MVALETWPTELEVISTIGILYDTTDSSNETEGVAPIIVVTPPKVVAHSNETTDPMFSNTTAKEEQKKSSGRNRYGRKDFNFSTIITNYGPYCHYTEFWPVLGGYHNFVIPTEYDFSQSNLQKGLVLPQFF